MWLRWDIRLRFEGNFPVRTPKTGIWLRQSRRLLNSFFS